MDQQSQEQKIDFIVDRSNLYREEAITDLKVASIRRLIPVTPDGEDDKSRAVKYIGQTQLMSPHGLVPLQAALTANSLQEAIDAFPAAMQVALAEMVENIKKNQEKQQQAKKQNDSRIIVPGQ